MKIDLVKNGDLYHESLYERLEACLIESSNPDGVSASILGEFNVYELEKVLSILLLTIEDTEFD